MSLSIIQAIRADSLASMADHQSWFRCICRLNDARLKPEVGLRVNDTAVFLDCVRLHRYTGKWGSSRGVFDSLQLMGSWPGALKILYVYLDIMWNCANSRQPLFPGNGSLSTHQEDSRWLSTAGFKDAAGDRDAKLPNRLRHAVL